MNLLPILSHAYKVVIDIDVGAPGHEKHVVDSLNASDNVFLIMLMKTVPLPGAATNNSRMVMHTKMINIDISIERVLQKIFQT